MAEASDMVGGIAPPNEKPDRGATGNPLGQMNGDLVERFMKSYNITLSESELLDVVTALAQIAESGLRCGPAATEMHELSRRITEERTTARAARSSTEQLELRTSRRGKSTKERRRLSKGSK